MAVRSHGTDIRLGGLRQQRLLALLLLNNRHSVASERLLDELWDDPPQSARQQVHNAIGSLRRARSAADILLTDNASYRLAVPDDDVDERLFQSRMRAARQVEGAGRPDDATRLLRLVVEVWRGDAFAGTHSPAIDSVAAKLNEQRLAAHENLMSPTTGKPGSVNGTGTGIAV